MKLFPVRTQAPRLPALVLVCLLLCLGAALGFAVCRAVPQQDRQELSDYLHEYAQATADGQGPSASARSVGAAYFRYPAAALLLGLTAAGLVLLPVLSVVQGFFLSFSVGCFARALGRGGVYLALAAFGPRCLFVLPCTLLLTVQDGEKNGEAPGEPVTLPDAVMAVLAPGGAYHANQLAGLTRAAWDASSECVDESTGEILPHPWSDSQFEEALWSLVWQGKVTNSSFDPLRSLGASSHAVKAPARASRRRVRVRVSVPANMTGLWSAVPHADMREERGAIARVEALLDRYGGIAPPMIDKERLDGGFSGLYPVLRRMEEHGALMRGMFVSGCGAAQFASRQTVDALRACAAEPSAVVLDATDPANLYGSVIAWPRTIGGYSIRPARRSGASVVLRGGRLLAYAVPRSHHLLLAQVADPALQQACYELAFALQRNLRDGCIRVCVTFCDANDEPLTARGEWSRMLKVAGFVPVPQGMKLFC